MANGQLKPFIGWCRGLEPKGQGSTQGGKKARSSEPCTHHIQPRPSTDFSYLLPPPVPHNKSTFLSPFLIRSHPIPSYSIPFPSITTFISELTLHFTFPSSPSPLPLNTTHSLYLESFLSGSRTFLLLALGGGKTPSSFSLRFDSTILSMAVDVRPCHLRHRGFQRYWGETWRRGGYIPVPK